MLRLRGSRLLLAVTCASAFACARNDEPEPLAAYGAKKLSVMRSTDIHGTPIVYAYLFPGDGDRCPPLAEVKASIDGRSLVTSPGGNGRTCFGASFRAPLVVLKDSVDFHELSIADDTAAIHTTVAGLRSDARLLVVQDGDAMRMRFDKDVRGTIDSAIVVWSGTVHGDVATDDGRTVVARIPREVDRSGRVVVQVDLVVDLEVGACDGIASCSGNWLVHEVLDVSMTR